MIRFFREERGNVTILMAAAMIFLIAMAALAIDMGYLYFRKSRVSAYADAASLAGAVALRDKKDEGKVIGAVESNLAANGYTGEYEIEIVGDEVHVNLSQPGSLFFGRALRGQSGDGVEAPVVAGYAGAGLVQSGEGGGSSTGGDSGDVYTQGAVVCFNENESGVVHGDKIINGIVIHGAVTLNSKTPGAVVFHSNHDIDANNGAVNNLKGEVEPQGTYVGTFPAKPKSGEDNYFTQRFFGTLEKVSPVNSPYAFLQGKQISAVRDLEELFPSVDNFMYYRAEDIEEGEISFEDGEPGLVYIDGDLLVRKRELDIKCNGGLVIINGSLEVGGGGARMDVDGVIYATGAIDIHGKADITGALWSEKCIYLHGAANAAFDITYSELNPIFIPGGATYSIKLIR